jgi:uncharacterized protein (TIGR03435 family)
VLEVAKNGPAMEKSTGSEAAANTTTSKTGGVIIDARNIDMKSFAQVLSRKMDLPVIDSTGLDGMFNFKLSWMPDTTKPGGNDVEDVSIFEALQKQIGLSMHKGKAEVETIVIDHVEEPSAN